MQRYGVGRREGAEGNGEINVGGRGAEGGGWGPVVGVGRCGCRGGGKAECGVYLFVYYNRADEEAGGGGGGEGKGRTCAKGLDACVHGVYDSNTRIV